MNRKPKKVTRSAGNTKASGAIWWAIDPFNDEDKFHENALRVLAPLARAFNTSVVPVVYVDSYRALEKSGHRFPLIPVFRQPFDGLRALAEDRLAKIGSRGFQSVLAQPIFLTHEPREVPTLHEKVTAITKEAKQRNAMCVALQSHSRRGLKRLYMGSFAETFMLSSTVPTLILNPQTTAPDKLKRILFPTDFSRGSLAAFKKVSDLAARLSAELTIVHYFSVLSPPAYLDRVTVKQLKKEYEQKDRSIEERGKALAAKAKSQGVKASFHLLRSSGAFDPSGGLLAFAKREGTDLIALAAQSSALETELLGATSREIVRSAKCPVLIYRA